MEIFNILLGILASILSICSVVKNKKSEKKINSLVRILNESGIEVNISNGKKNKQMIVKDKSNGIIGNKNSITTVRSDKE